MCFAFHFDFGCRDTKTEFVQSGLHPYAFDCPKARNLFSVTFVSVWCMKSPVQNFKRVAIKSIVALSFFSVALTGFSAETSLADTNDVRFWLTNAFTPWLRRSYPEITTKFYPDWLHDHPAGLEPTPFTNWLSEVFPDLETEMYPTWMENISSEQLGTNIPAWWASVRKGKFSVSPTPQPVPTIVRGPYLQLGTTNSIVVRWRTDIASTSTVFYGSSQVRLSRNARSSGTLADHAVLLTNLSPATKYFYGLGPNDTPLIVHVTNNIAFVGSTNSKIYVSRPGTREQVAVATRDTFVFSVKQKSFIVSDPEQSFTARTTNQSLVVNTPNNAVLLTISNNAIVVTTSNHVVWLGDNAKTTRSGTRNFLVGTTNLIHVGGDSNTFFITHPLIGSRPPTRVWVFGRSGNAEESRARRA